MRLDHQEECQGQEDQGQEETALERSAEIFRLEAVTSCVCPSNAARGALAILNGLLLASLVAIVAAIAFEDMILGAVIALAMVINLMVAAISGSLLPSILGAMGIDPAIAGGVVLTTITDVTGFFVFLGLATWAYA